MSDVQDTVEQVSADSSANFEAPSNEDQNGELATLMIQRLASEASQGSAEGEGEGQDDDQIEVEVQDDAEGEQPAPEAEAAEAAPEVPEKPAQPDPSVRVAGLVRKWQARESELLNRIKELESQPKVEAPPADLRDLRRQAKRDPMKVLSDLGINQDLLVHMILNDGKLPDNHAKEIAQLELEERLERMEQQLLEKEQKAKVDGHELQVLQFKQQLEAGIRSQAKRWPILNDEEMFGTVYDIMNQKFQEDGSILKYEDVCDFIEEELRLKAKKYVAYMEPKVESQEPKVAGKGLNNNMASKRPTSQPPRIEDPTERAIAIFQREMRKDN